MELRLFGAPLHGAGRELPGGDDGLHGVEVTGADERLVTRGAVTLGFVREFASNGHIGEWVLARWICNSDLHFEELIKVNRRCRRSELNRVAGRGGPEQRTAADEHGCRVSAPDIED